MMGRARAMRWAAWAVGAACAMSGCTAPPPAQPMYDTVPVDAAWGEAGPPAGALWSASAAPAVPGAVVAQGFFLRRFATVVSPRSMSFAPNGDLFVTSPARGTPGGEGGGAGAIVVLSDDDRDGVAETHTFLDGVADVHAVAVRGGFVYFTTERAVFRTPYTTGLRREMPGMRVVAHEFMIGDESRWTHGLDVREDGTLFTSLSVWGTSRECGMRPSQGEIFRRDASGARRVVQGLRNPLYIRCHPSEPLCLAAELGDDRGPTWGALEKLVALEDGMQEVGFPCCITQGRSSPYNSGFDCAAVTPGVATFPLTATPFGMDWERGVWPGPFHRGLFVALHGSFYSSPKWAGARVVFAATDATGRPVGSFMDFLLGFGPDGSPLERPADVTFSTDGRLFVADDHAGAVYWIAPDELRRR
jgi:glucose/arabinose dehydrogenase